MTWKMNVLFYSSIKKENNKGDLPIYCRITINGKRAEFSTGIKTTLQEWPEIKRGKVSAKQAFLQQLRTKINAVYLERTFNSSDPTAEEIKLLLREPVVIDCRTLSEQFLLYKSNELHPNTLRGLRSMLSRIKVFCGKEPASRLADVWPKFHDWIKLDCEQDRQKKYYLLFCQLHQYAKKRGYQLPNIPDHVWKKKPKKDINHLTRDDLQKIENLVLQQTRLDKIRKLFLIQCKTGLSYSDLKRFDHRLHLKQHDQFCFISMNRKKTKSAFVVPLNQNTCRLINEFEHGFAAPSNQKYNSYIKEVVFLAGVETRVTSHTARRTFAMNSLNNGFSIEAVSHMLGHASPLTTLSHYAKVKDERVFNEFLKLLA